MITIETSGVGLGLSSILSNEQEILSNLSILKIEAVLQHIFLFLAKAKDLSKASKKSES